jgi:hypothetical protein
MGSLLQALDSNFPHLQSGVATLRAGLLTFIDDLHHMDWRKPRTSISRIAGSGRAMA